MITTTVETITPAKAKTYLESNSSERNRKISTKRVRDYARAMAAGQWLLNGSPIIFGQSGRLLDGQHRLHGSIAGDAAFDSVVIRGVEQEDEAFGTIDQGYTRTAGQILQASGYASAFHLAAGVGLVLKLRSGTILNRTLHPNTTDISTFIAKNPSIQESVRIGIKLRGLAMPSVAIGLHFCFAEIDKFYADHFITALVTGINLTEGSPILALRRSLERNAISKGKLPQEVQVAYFIKAWNAFRSGSNLKMMRWSVNEEFPEILK